LQLINNSVLFSSVKVIHSASIWLLQTQTWIHNQVKYLPKDIESHIVCQSTENLDQFYLPNIHVIRKKSLLSRYGGSGLKGASPMARILWLWRMCQKIKPEIVHSHFGNMGWYDSLVVRLMKARHVVTFYGFDVNMLPTQKPIWRKRYQSLFNSADLFLCEGEHMAGCLAKLGCPPDKAKVHHLGVEVDKILFKPRKWRPGETLRVLIAASFREKKGIPYALAALGRLQEEISLEITIIGDATAEERDQEEKERIFGVIEMYEMQSKIKMLGFQPYSVLLEQAYGNHIFISPSVTASDGDTEGGAPVTIIEMAASGLPVVSTMHCDIPGVIEDGVTGLLAPERDVDGLVTHIRWLLESHDSWETMLKEGRKKIEREFDVRVQAQRLGEIYRKILD
jgi:colanic acid/amylovoran biosynthesis glycosyltransferase